MTYKDYERFAKENNIATSEVEGEFGSGYPCVYLYYEPESVIECISKLKAEIKVLSGGS